LYLSPSRKLAKTILRITGYIPSEPALYQLALTHSSSVRSGDDRDSRPKAVALGCNERLEFLGDSILDTVIAEYLFKMYPLRDEGFLTEMRSKIVNRKSLNEICRKLGIDELIRHRQAGSINDSMYGDALEAFIGAVYLDHGFDAARRFVHRRILRPYIQLHEVETQVISYKNKLIEHVQRSRMGLLMFVVIEELGEGRNKVFRIQAKVGEKVLGVGEGKNKKSAEQRASEDALLRLNAIA
jgi:ribonuclease-3